MVFAWLMKSYHAAWRPLRAHWDGPHGFQSFFLMDDQIQVEPDLGRRAFLSVELAEEGALAALGKDVKNEEKDREEGALEQAKHIWGLRYDTDTLTCAIPAEKVKEAHYLSLIHI